MEWSNKTCLKCKYNIRDECRRFPPTNLHYTGGIAASYPNLKAWTSACAEYEEPK